MSAVSTGPRAKARAGGNPADRRRRWRRLARRPAWRLPESREERLAVIGLTALLVTGALLRLLFVLAWRPAFMGWPDAASYIEVSQGSGGTLMGNAELFGNPLRPAGRVAAIVPVNPWWMGAPTFSAIVPERLLREGANSIKGYWTS